MGRHIDHYQSRQLDALIAECLEKLELTTEYARDSGEEGDLEEHQRLEQVFRLIGRRLQRLDPVLASPAQVDTLVNKIGAAKSEIDGYQVDGTAQHLVSANNAIDGALSLVAQFPLPLDGQDVVAINDAARTLRQSVGQLVRNIRSERDPATKALRRTKQKAEELAESIESQKARLDQALSQYQSQFSEQENVRRSAFDSKLQALEQEWRDQQKLVSDSAAEQQNKKLQEHEDIAQGLKSEVASLVERFETDLEASREQYSQTAESIIAQLGDSRDSAANIVNLVANSGVVGHYHQRAVVAERLTWLWQGVTIVSMGASLWYAIVGLTPLLSEPGTSIVQVLGRLAIVSLISAPGVWASRQANVYRRREQAYRDRELKLATLEPFIDSLSSDQATGVRQQFAETFFLAAGTLELDEDSTSAAPSLSIDSFEKLIGTLSKLLREAGK